MANPLLNNTESLVNPLTGEVSNSRVVGMKQNTISNQIAAGIDTGQALAQRGAQGFSEAIGFGDSEFAMNMADSARKNEMRAARVPVEGLADQVLRGLGTVGVAAIPAIATAPLSGSAAIGATVLTSAGLNLGDIKSKSLELDAESETGIADVLSATALGSLEAIPLFRLKSALKPVGEAVQTSLSQTALRGATKVGEASIVGGLTEGAQDFTTSMLAYQFTGSEITDEALAKIIDNSIDEAIVGGILSGPLGAIETTAEVVQNNQALKDLANFTTNEDGEQVYQAPVEDKLQNPGLFKRTLANLVGRTPDKILVSDIGGFTKVQDLVADFVQNPTERSKFIGKNTVSNLGQLKAADLQKAARDFLDSPDKVAKAAVEARVTGTVPTDPEVKKAFDSLSELFDKESFNQAAKVGIADDINWRNEKYMPLMNVDADAVLKDPIAFANAAKADVLRRGFDEEAGNKAFARAEIYARNLGQNGFYHYGARSNGDVGALFKQQIDKAYYDGGSTASLGKSLRKVDTAKVKNNNPLEQERFLTELSQEFWTDYTTDDVKGNVFSYIQSIGERLAHVEKFGKNNEKYWTKVREALADASNEGVVVTSDMVDRFVDMINISQRLPTKAVSLQARKWTNRVRAFENITKLPLAILPSLAEVMVIRERVGSPILLSSVGKQIKNSAISSVKQAIGKRPDKTVADDLGLSLAEAANVMSSRLGDDTFNPSLIEQRFFNLTGLPQFTELLRITAATAAEKSFVRDAQKLATTTNQGEIRSILKKFAEAGLDGQKVKNWVVSGMDKTDSYYTDHIRMGLLNIVEDTVVNPKPINRPAWTSDERLKLLAQMKSFATVFTNGVMRTWFDKMTKGGGAEQIAAASRILPVVASMMMFQVYMGAVREWAKTGDIERWEEEDVWDHMLTGVSYLGAGGFLVDPVKAKTFGVDATSALLGPAVSDFNKAVAGLTPILSGEVSPEDFVESVIKNTTRSFPGSGIVFDQLGIN